MPVTHVNHDKDTHTLTFTAEFAAPRTRVWQIYADPRQLEKVWGPPTYPATFVDHSLSPGSRITYFMTGPQGEKYAGYWDITEVNKPHSFSFRDGFADEHLVPDPSLPVTVSVFSFSERDGKTKVTYASTYANAKELQQVLDMGVIEGASGAINQIDALLASST